MEINEVKSRFSYLLFFLTLIILSSCHQEEKVKKTEYDALMAEFSEYRASVNAANQLGVKHQADLNQALSDLSKISGMTLSLRGNIENRTAKISQSEQIKSHIHAIEKRMDDLEKQAGNNSILKKSIAQLKVIIREKQLEINDLHRQIKEQGLLIDTLKVSSEQKQRTIESQDRALTLSQNKIKEQHAQLLESLYNAAHDIELLAVQAPKMKFGGNKKKMKEYQIKVAELALRYYNIAAGLGHEPSKTKSKSVVNFINKLRNE